MTTDHSVPTDQKSRAALRAEQEGRLTLGAPTTDAEIERVLELLPLAVARGCGKELLLVVEARNLLIKE